MRYAVTFIVVRCSSVLSAAVELKKLGRAIGIETVIVTGNR